MGLDGNQYIQEETNRSPFLAVNGKITREEITETILEKFWIKKGWPKAKAFLSLASRGKILTEDQLWKRGFEGPTRCVLCEQEENAYHLQISFIFAWQIWGGIFNLFGINWFSPNAVIDLVGGTQVPWKSKRLKGIWNMVPAMTCWKICLERNHRIFRDRDSSTLSLEEKSGSNLVDPQSGSNEVNQQEKRNF